MQQTSYERYVARMDAAYRDARDLLISLEIDQSIQFSLITEEALQAIETHWANDPTRKVAWDWREVRDALRKKKHRPFEVAIWHNEVLCGLAIGPISRGKHRIYVEGVEGSPTRHQLVGRIALIALTVAESYAGVLGARQIWLYDPDPAVIPLYETMGYTISMERCFSIRKLRFCVKTLQTDAEEGP